MCLYHAQDAEELKELLGRMWAALSDEARAVFDEKEREDRER